MVPQISIPAFIRYAGRENFANYVTANNRGAVFPAIAAALGVTAFDGNRKIARRRTEPMEAVTH